MTGPPKFTIDGATISLKPTLMALGMRVPFSDAADFSGLREGGGLKIPDVVHQAFIKVNEQGTEAAAVFGPTSAPAEPVELVVDEPFLVLIRDDVTGAILFLGRVVDPR